MIKRKRKRLKRKTKEKEKEKNRNRWVQSFSSYGVSPLVFSQFLDKTFDGSWEKTLKPSPIFFLSPSNQIPIKNIFYPLFSHFFYILLVLPPIKRTLNLLAQHPLAHINIQTKSKKEDQPNSTPALPISKTNARTQLNLNPIHIKLKGIM